MTRSNSPVFYRTALIYGLPAGLIPISAITIGMALQSEVASSSQWFGYLIMLIALLLIFVGVKRYRDMECGGVIRFWQAFWLGIAMAITASIAYVIVWEVYLFVTDHAYMDTYIAGLMEARQAAGATAAEMQQEMDNLKRLREQYANPLFRLPITFLEIFPVGFIVALFVAALLRKPTFLPRAV